MKKIFIYSSILLTAIYIVWMMVSLEDSILFSSYPSAFLKEVNLDANREKLAADLKQLAMETNSLIAKRIAAPDGQKKRTFTYELFGSGSLPEGLSEANEEAKRNSSLAGGYLIVDGKLTAKELADRLALLGHVAHAVEATSPLQMVVFFVISSVFLLSAFVFLLTFSAFAIIFRMKDLRFAGIRILSGESLFFASLRPVWSDIKDIFIANVIIGTVFTVFLIFWGVGQAVMISLLWWALLCYSVLLIGISVLLSVIYIMGLKRNQLVGVLKGKLPLIRLLGIIFVGQLLAIMIVTWSFNQSMFYYSLFQEQKSAENDWQKQGNFVNITFNLGMKRSNVQEREKLRKKWYFFAKEAVEKENALYVEHNLRNFIMEEISDGVRLEDYKPNGNTIYVTPNYLEYQGIYLDENLKNKLKNLKKGQYGLLLPEKLKKDSEYYQGLYRETLQDYNRKSLEADSPLLFETDFIVGYVPNQQRRFLYNSKPGLRTQTQYLMDPIIVVCTPEGMGQTPSTEMSWMSAAGNYLQFQDYDKTIELLKKHDLYSLVSGLTNSRFQYYENVSDTRIKLIALLSGTLLAVITSLLLFNSMNLLYFEQFRRDIFIKRVSGMSFWELHKNYLMLQSIVLLIGFCISLFLAKNIGINIAILLLFQLNAWITLLYQMQAENKTAVTVLKGK